MLYAKVVVGLPVEGPFDYLIPENLIPKVKVGSRVRVPFGPRKLTGYVIEISPQTRIPKVKPLLELIDDFPILDKNMLLLTKNISDYYCCSWGEAIETALPEQLRKGKKIPQGTETAEATNKNNPLAILIHDLDGNARWDIYIPEIEKALENHQSIILIFPDKDSVRRAQKIINEKFPSPAAAIFYRKQPHELEEWCRVKEGKVNIVIGTRSAIFAPFSNLGVVIIDEEEDFVYKQDQTPHYHAREVSFMRINLEKAKLILGSAAPSLEAFHLAKEAKIKYQLIPRKKSFPQVKIIDTSRSVFAFKEKRGVFTKYLEDAIAANLNEKGKALLFLNRRGFSTFASCNSCGIVLKCPRCNINLVYHFTDKLLFCHYCNYKITASQICPECNSGYIRYSGTGTERVESELSRIFPQAKIKNMDKAEEIDLKEADIFIATESIVRKGVSLFDLVGVLAIDNSLNHIDLRSSEKTFNLLVELLQLTRGRLIIQTRLSRHYCFRALEKDDFNIFYAEELKQRRQLKFPPFRHLGLVKLRGKKETRVEEASKRLFEKLKSVNKNKNLRVISVNPGRQVKLRGNFYWQVLLKAESALLMSKFLKINLKHFPHSDIIITVDIDPI